LFSPSTISEISIKYPHFYQNLTALVTAYSSQNETPLSSGQIVKTTPTTTASLPVASSSSPSSISNAVSTTAQSTSTPSNVNPPITAATAATTKGTNNSNSSPTHSTLFNTIKQGDVNLLKQYVQQCTPSLLNHIDPVTGLTLLHYACRIRPLTLIISNILTILASYGADPTIRNPRSGKTCLHYLYRDYGLKTDLVIKMAHILLGSGASLHSQDWEGETPLWFAVRSGDLTLVDWTLKQDTTPQSLLKGKNKRGNPLLDETELPETKLLLQKWDQLKYEFMSSFAMPSQSFQDDNRDSSGIKEKSVMGLGLKGIVGPSGIDSKYSSRERINELTSPSMVIPRPTLADKRSYSQDGIMFTDHALSIAMDTTDVLHHALIHFNGSNAPLNQNDESSMIMNDAEEHRKKNEDETELINGDNENENDQEKELNVADQLDVSHEFYNVLVSKWMDLHTTLYDLNLEHDEQEFVLQERMNEKEMHHFKDMDIIINELNNWKKKCEELEESLELEKAKALNVWKVYEKVVNINSTYSDSRSNNHNNYYYYNKHKYSDNEDSMVVRKVTQENDKVKDKL